MYYLKHYFDPDFNHTKLLPKSERGGRVNYKYLGYVQNVVKGQLLACLFSIDEIAEGKRDPRFIYKQEYLPCGPNCIINPSNKNQIIAAENGYCFYHNGLITIKKLLNIRGNVGLQTGNVFYINDLAVHGNVQTGFSLYAANILVKGRIESAKVKSTGDLVCLQGVKGTNEHSIESEDSDITNETIQNVPSALLEAQGNIRLPFCEHAQLRTKESAIIDQHSLNSILYIGGNLVVKGRLQGGSVFANNNVYVKNQLGSEYISTKIVLGYDPFKYLALQKLEKKIIYLEGKVGYFYNMASRNAVMEQEYKPRYGLAKYKLDLALKKRKILWEHFEANEKQTCSSRVIVPGKVHPGCEISIGKAYLKVTEPLKSVVFKLVDGDIKFFKLNDSAHECLDDNHNLDSSCIERQVIK